MQCCRNLTVDAKLFLISVIPLLVQQCNLSDSSTGDVSIGRARYRRLRELRAGVLSDTMQLDALS